MRKLKYAEQKLLKHTDFFNWEVDNNLHEIKIIRKYYIQKREHYTFYNKLSRQIREIARKIKELDPKDPYRIEAGGQLIEKLHTMGIIPTKWNLQLLDKVTASSFCRRRLPSILVKNKMAPHLKSAVTFVEQGHVRVGADVVKDPAYLVSRVLEDYVTWVDSSKIKEHILQYNEMKDDFDFENC
ncbi:U3 small nucleolar ribonucleoprotein IMP3 [Armadillidium vulgare]|nr:U3 small nucleolar ribonucleoprotein IMP3 [Armadillidium vulgare]